MLQPVFTRTDEGPHSGPFFFGDGSRACFSESVRSLFALSLAFASLSCADTSSHSEDDLPRLLAIDYCDSLEACACSRLETDHGSYEGCVAELTADHQLLQDLARASGWTFQPDCLDQAVASGPNCNSSEDWALDDSADQPLCNYYTGSKGEGEACEGGFGFSDCAEGLACVFDACTQWPLASTLPGAGEPCSMGLCESDSYCGPEGNCVARAFEGEACSAEAECHSWCCTDNLCSPGMPAICGNGCADAA